MSKSAAIATLCAVGLLMPFPLPSVAQQPGAIPQFSTVETHEHDTINLGTLGIQTNVPIRSKAGHIPYSYRLAGANQITVSTHGLFVLSEFLTHGEAHVPGQTGSTSTQCYNHGIPDGSYLSNFYVIDALGNSHPFNFLIGTSTSACPHPSINGGYAVDNSGLYLNVNWNNGQPIYTMYDMSGNNSTTTTGVFPNLLDPHGNTITDTTDTLGETVMTVGGQGTQFTWTDALNNNQTVTTNSTQQTLWTAFGCTADLNPVSVSFVTSISFPDSTMSFGWEKSRLNSSDYTGRLASITLPTGGKISYAYSGGTNGINCLDGTPATITRTTPDGTWTYTHVASQTSPTTTVTDPQGNNSVYTFVMGEGSLSGGRIPLEAEKQVYNGAVNPANLVQTVFTCYNNTSSSPTNCNPNPPVGWAVFEKDVYTTYPNVTGYSAVKTAYDVYGRVTDVKTYDFNLVLINEKQIQYGSGSPSSQTCTAISTYIIDKPCSVTLLDSQNNNAILSQTWNSYSSTGDLLQTWNLVSGSGAGGTYLSKQYSYDSHGVVQTMTDVNGQVINYTTTSCNNMFVTSQYPTNFSNLQTSQTWDCNGGVVTSSTDANGQLTHTDFYVGTATDPFYRPLDSKDELGFATNFSYTPNSTEGTFSFNGGNSIIDTVSTTDSIGRTVTAQVSQSPTSQNWDAASRTFDSAGRPYQRSLPCATTSKGTGCGPSTETQSYDALNRPLVHTGPGGDVVTKTYPANDVLTTLTPAPANENAKSVQKEYDGLGRLKSACLISSAPGNGPCNQANGGTGFLTKYTYDAAGRLLQTVENAQVSSPTQTRSYTYDKLGRLLTETNPEWAGFATYTYDAASVNPGCPTPTGMSLYATGDLVAKVDPKGNVTCYFYDGLHRNIAVTYGGPDSYNGQNKFFVYDAATVNGMAMTTAEGRLAEAYTCAGVILPCTSIITDEGYSYDARGLLSDYYQKSQHSSGYYHLSATRWEDKQIKAVSGVGLPTITFGASDGSGLDGEGRVTKVTASSGTNPVSAAIYNTGSYANEPIGALLTVTLGAGDAQNFTYDKNTGRMLSYAASVGSTPTVISGSLNWNANGTLQQLSISDGYNSADTQVCSYLYDDFVRIAGTTGSNPIPGVNCVNGSTKIWNQTFTYGSDSFGNITKSTTGPGASWACTACYNTATNQYNSTLSGSITYDSDGNLTNDTFHTYTWLVDGHVATIDTNTITYDANGNKVEENVGGTIHEYVSAFGVSAQMTGTTEKATTVDLPGGVQALYSGGTLQRFRFPDWQGTIRAESNPTTRVFTESLAFAPFGDRYTVKGTPYNVDSFTGKPDQIVRDEYDFPARQEHNGQGRWVSPDPIPGTGNKYVYADNNPLSKVDPYGLMSVVVDEMETSNGDELAVTGVNQTESHPSQTTQTSGQSTSGQNQESSVDHSEDSKHGKIWRWFHDHSLLVQTDKEKAAALHTQAQSIRNQWKNQTLYMQGRRVDWNKLTDQQVIDLTKYIQWEENTLGVLSLVGPVSFSSAQLQAKFKHAQDFGVQGTYNQENVFEFERALEQHLTDPNTKLVQGSYRGNPANIYVNSTTGNAVITDPSGEFISGWKLSPAQMNYVMTTGSLN
jgi:RHS repeat-associated protein